MRYISLFSSSGIGTYGLKQDGHKCIATNEILEERMHFQKINKIGVDKDSYITGDIKDLKIKERIYSQVKKYKGVDLIISTPPCQGISLINLKKNEKDKFRNSLVVESLKIIKKTNPKIFMIENVSKFLKTACFHKEKWKTIKQAILDDLEKEYSIIFKVLNLKYIGSNSSRTRTIIIGLKREISKHFSPWELLPSRVEKIPTLYDVIGSMKSLKWGEWCENDFYHGFRIYDKRMKKWITNLEPGQSAFDNSKLDLKPHKIINGKIYINANSTGDKYKRQFPDKVAPCIMTRNDQLASQNTIHFYDDRVFSIRELMKLMTIPESFKFFEKGNSEFHKLKYPEKIKYYKKYELNIRRSIGEAVPTFLFKNIIRNFMRENSKLKINSKSELAKYIQNNNLKETNDLINHINYVSRITLNNLFEMLEKKSKETGLYFTNPNIVTDLLNDIKIDGNRVIEPSVGLGSFIIPLIKAFPEKELKIKVFDINNSAIKILKKMVSYKSIKYLNEDFLSRTNLAADLIIGNPPYVNITKKDNIYNLNSNAKNLFQLFLYKSIEISKNVIFVFPKYVLYNHKYSKFREYMKNNNIYRFWDYKGMLFPNAKIETAVIEFKQGKHKMFISDGVSFDINMLFNKISSIFTIHPNMKIIEYSKTLHFLKNITSTRLLKLNKKYPNINNGVKVISSKNLRGFDSSWSVSEKGFEKEIRMNGILIPNMTQNIKAIKKPKNTLWNGSLALANIPKEYYKVALKTWNSEEFKSYINMLRSGAERSINIDKEIIKHFGVENE